MAKEKTVRTDVELPPADDKKLTRIAKREGRSKRWMVRFWVRQAIKTAS